MVEIYAIFSLLLILPVIYFKLIGKQILFKKFFSDFDIKLKYIYQEMYYIDIYIKDRKSI